MNVALRRPMMLDEFLAWERQQDLRYEFDGTQPVAMTGGTVAHSVIATNLVRALEDRLRDGSCRAFRGDLKIVVAGRVRYPDAVVTCSPVANDADVVPDPVVVFEVLSASTASTDRIEKNEEYRATPSIQRSPCWSRHARRRPCSPVLATTGWDTCSPAAPSFPCPRSASSCPWLICMPASSFRNRPQDHNSVLSPVFGSELTNEKGCYRVFDATMDAIATRLLTAALRPKQVQRRPRRSG